MDEILDEVGQLVVMVMDKFPILTCCGCLVTIFTVGVIGGVAIALILK